MKPTLTASFLLIVATLLAQPAPVKAQGKIEVVEPYSVSRLLQQFADFIEEIETIEGYRVQIIATSDLQQANGIKGGAMSRYHRMYNVYLDYFAPYYKVRVGDFRTRLAAFKCLMEVQEKFPDAYIVKDMIEVSEL